MINMRLIAVLSMLFLFALGAPAARAAGCTCSPDPFEDRWDAADVVFTATVVEIKVLHEYLRKDNANDMPVRVRLRLIDKFKGPASLRTNGGFELQTSLTRDTCTGHPFEEGKNYLVYAYRRNDETFEATSLYNMPARTYDVGGLCGGTKILTDAAAIAEVARIRKKLSEEPEEKPKGLMDKIFGN